MGVGSAPLRACGEDSTREGSSPQDEVIGGEGAGAGGGAPLLLGVAERLDAQRANAGAARVVVPAYLHIEVDVVGAGGDAAAGVDGVGALERRHEGDVLRAHRVAGPAVRGGLRV